MKLGVSYTVFDGIELLEYSIVQIREHVDFIHVAYQDRSWFGHLPNPGDINKLKELQNRKLIDSLECFSSFQVLKPNGSNISRSKRYETQKRQMGLNTCLRNRCTHFMSMDVDEFYKSEQFKNAKDIILKENISLSSCSFINYVNLPIYNRGYDSATVPFICKVNQSSKMTRGFFTKCDPTRGITKASGGKNLRFDKKALTMHHMETVRKNLTKKYQATTRAIFNRNRTSELVNSIKSINENNNNLNFKKIIFPALNNIKINSCENHFNIPYEKWI